MQIEQVKTQIIATGSARVRLFPGRRVTDKSHPLFCSDYYQQWKDAAEEEKAEVSAQLLEEFASGLTPGTYTVSMQRSESAVRSRMNVPLDVKIDPAVAGLSGGAPQYLPPQKTETQIREEIWKEVEREREMEDLTAELSEVKRLLKEKNSFGDKVLQILQQMGLTGLENQGIPARNIANTIGGQVQTMSQNHESLGDAFEGDGEDPNQRFQVAIEGITGKLGDRSPEFMEKLNRLSPEKINALCSLPDEQIDLLTGAL
ncbi:MAG: hypothetical protein AAFR66_02170 [Bacteroidota bacterium]